jgi:hypothetical protein
MTSQQQQLWTSKAPENLPDFILGGAMKSGTTSLHSILNAHPDVAMAHEELGFFDIDDVLQHSDFNFFDSNSKAWHTQSMDTNSKELWSWYERQFERLNKTVKLIGEDSTSYLGSEIAARRIALQDKPIKLVFILRHPTKRAISNYLHHLKSGRSIYSLEDTLRYNPNSIIRRSLYKEQLEDYYKHIPAERIKVVLFEDFIKNKKKCVNELCEFLNIDFHKFDTTVFDTHSNKTKLPKHISLQIYRNKLLQKRNNYRYSSFLPIQTSGLGQIPFRYRILDKIHKAINPQSTDNRFLPLQTTQSFLDNYFKQALEGLDGLIGKEAYSTWFEE